MNRPCPPDCPHCEAQAEARADALPERGEWQRGQDDYERYLDRLGGSA